MRLRRPPELVSAHSASGFSVFSAGRMSEAGERREGPRGQLEGPRPGAGCSRPRTPSPRPARS